MTSFIETYVNSKENKNDRCYYTMWWKLCILDTSEGM